MTPGVTLHKAERALTLDWPCTPALQTLLPAAFPLGVEITGLAHDIDACIRLRALGIDVPTPIETYYTWPRDLSLTPTVFAHQQVTAGFATTNPRSYCLNGIGTGKTLTYAWAADYLLSIGAARRVLVVTPLSTLERVWGDALFFHMPHRSFAILHGSAERRRRLLATPKDFYIVNHDGIGVLEKELMARPDIDIVIIDEVADYSNRQTAKWKSMDHVIYPPGGTPRPWVWGLTATPTPNAPTDAYGQCKLVTPATVPMFYTSFRNMVMEHMSTHVWIPRAEANRTVYSIMKPAIRFKRDDCTDLPGAIYSTRDVELSAEQTTHYKRVMKELHTEVQGGKVTAVNEGVKLSKLMQIACGCVYDTKGVPREIDAGNRLETLMQLIEQCGEKVIVFVPLTAVTGMLWRELRKHWNFEVVTGETPVRERNDIFGRFQQPTSDLDIIAHPECMSHGLTLTEASTIIWYAPIDSNKIYEQANGRITRIGQKYVANIIHLAGSAVERRVYKRLELRQKLQGALLEMVERGEQ